MNMFNTAKFLSGGKEGEEQQLLCLWQGKDVVNKSECMCVRWDAGGSVVAALAPRPSFCRVTSMSESPLSEVYLITK